MKNVLLALPAYPGYTQNETLHTVIRLQREIVARGWGCVLEDRAGSGLIHTVRNYFVAKMLAGDFTDLFFLDDDVGTEDAQAGIRLLEAPVDVAAGVYPTRFEPQKWMVRYIQGQKELWTDPKHGLLEVEGVPAGFLRISRDCLLQMVYHYPELEYEDEDCPDGRTWGLFYPEIRDRHSFGEDMNFCLKWRAIGGKVWVDPLIHFKHIGRKAYEGCFGDWLRSRERLEAIAEDQPMESAA